MSCPPPSYQKTKGSNLSGLLDLLDLKPGTEQMLILHSTVQSMIAIPCIPMRLDVKFVPTFLPRIHNVCRIPTCESHIAGPGHLDKCNNDIFAFPPYIYALSTNRWCSSRELYLGRDTWRRYMEFQHDLNAYFFLFPHPSPSFAHTNGRDFRYSMG